MATVLLIVAPGVHLLDVSGPAQVFCTANEYGARYEVRYVGPSPLVQSHEGLGLTASTRWPRLRSEDTVIVAGWQVGGGALHCPIPERYLAAISAHHHSGGRVASVCSGSIALALAGMLNGRHATTHHELQERLAAEYREIRVVPDVLYVSDGRIYTSAGVASGIDLALHLVALDYGPRAAARTARSLVVAARRSGESPQGSVMLRYRDHLSDLVHRAQDIIDTRFAEPLSLHLLAGELSVSPRTLTRAFRSATRMTPLTYQRQLRLEHAQALVESGWTREQAARAVGFADARTLRARRPAESSPALAR